jgi:ribose 5-phosphate isomerase B
MSATQIKIAIGSDHAGFDYKEFLKTELTAYEVKDFGTYSSGSADYPDFAHPVAEAVENGEFTFGILICGSGNGISIAANKHQGIRAAICWENELAALCRMHNDANIISIPARYVSKELAIEMVMTFLNTAFEGGRHQDRVNKISC